MTRVDQSRIHPGENLGSLYSENYRLAIPIGIVVKVIVIAGILHSEESILQEEFQVIITSSVHYRIGSGLLNQSEWWRLYLQQGPAG